MKNRNFCISRNLTVLRQIHKYSQEEVAEKIGFPGKRWQNGNPVKLLLILLTATLWRNYIMFP